MYLHVASAFDQAGMQRVTHALRAIDRREADEEQHGGGALLGVVLSFMMAVTTLSLPSLIMLRKAVKPRLLAVFTAICTTGIILVGYFFNFMQPCLL